MRSRLVAAVLTATLGVVPVQAQRTTRSAPASNSMVAARPAVTRSVAVVSYPAVVSHPGVSDWRTPGLHPPGWHPRPPIRGFYPVRSFYYYPYNYALYPYSYYPLGYYGFFDSYASSTYDDNVPGLASQIQSMQLQMNQLQQQQAQEMAYLMELEKQPAPAPVASAPPVVQPPQQSARTESAPATALVFADGHSEQIHNYAIVGQTLWIFSAERARKIPLAQLDLDATAKANEERGVDFRVPPHTKSEPH